MGFLLTSGCASVVRQDTPLIDDEYVQALEAANKYCEAWRWRNQDKGLAILSPRLLKSETEDFWRLVISGLSNPHHVSYEVTNGRRLRDGRYLFDVWFYELYTGETWRQIASGEVLLPEKKLKAERIIVVKTGQDKWGEDVWKVDEAP